MKKGVFVFVFSIACLVSACAPDPVILLSQHAVVTSSEAYNATIDVTTTYDWTATVSSSKWIKISPSSGPKGTTQVSLSIDANNLFDSRTGEVTFSSEGIRNQISILQEQKNSLLASGNFHLPFVSDTITVKLMANVNYVCSIPDDVDWVKDITTKGLTESYRTFSIEENTGPVARTAVISFTDRSTGTGSSVTIVQDPHIIFEISRDSISVACDDDSFTVTVRTNGEFKWNISKCDWLSCNDSPEFKVGEMAAYQLRFSLTGTPGHSSRNFTVVFVDANRVNYKLYVCQDAAPYIMEVTYSSMEIVAPTVTNVVEEATIDWGDGSPVEPYVIGMKHTYPDDSPHTVRVISKSASRFRLNDLCGVEKLDFRLF